METTTIYTFEAGLLNIPVTSVKMLWSVARLLTMLGFNWDMMIHEEA